MVDYVETAPNLKNPHLNGPPTMADLLFDYYAKAQYSGIAPLMHPDDVEAQEMAEEETNVERDEATKE